MGERRQQLLHRTLFPDEHVLAEGRANWLRLGQVPSGGSTHTYLWVTDRRLVWCNIWSTQDPWTISLNILTSYEGEVFDTHRYVLTFDTAP
ncbi:MAG TPA: hypothetical protein VGS09_08470 [Actinomycetota bacterium]|jgi:hypothetical protein|nr:hypothetical protein [Actinomycetota bacterium]